MGERRMGLQAVEGAPRPPRGGRRRGSSVVRRFLLLVAMITFAAVASPGSAMASAPIYSYSAAPSTTQAGGHPNLLTSFEFGTTYNQGYPNKCLCDDPENITNNLATGVIGDPNNVPKCTQANFDEISSERRSGNCSTDSQVGVAVVGILGNHIPEPVFNVEPDPHQAALLGFWLPIAAVPAFIVLKARTGGDFGLDAELSGIEHIIAPESVRTGPVGSACRSHTRFRTQPAGFLGCRTRTVSG